MDADNVAARRKQRLCSISAGRSTLRTPSRRHCGRPYRRRRPGLTEPKPNTSSVRLAFRIWTMFYNRNCNFLFQLNFSHWSISNGGRVPIHRLLMDWIEAFRFQVEFILLSLIIQVLKCWLLMDWIEAFRLHFKSIGFKLFIQVPVHRLLMDWIEAFRLHFKLIGLKLFIQVPIHRLLMDWVEAFRFNFKLIGFKFGSIDS